MSGKEKLVQVYVEGQSLGMSFEDALALAMQHDDFVADQFAIQAREAGVEPRKAE